MTRLPAGSSLPDRTRAATTVLFAAVMLSAFVFVAFQVYQRVADPEGHISRPGIGAILLPPADSMAETAETHLQAGLKALNDRSAAPGERLERYRDSLQHARRLLVLSLRRQPTQPRVLARLAAIGWELNPPLDPKHIRRQLETIELASEMASARPEVQRDLGELLIKMGRRDEALVYYERALRLDPGLANEIVNHLRTEGFDPREIVDGLPEDGRTLAALEPVFTDAGWTEEYLARLWPNLVERPSSAVLRAFASAHRDDPAGLAQALQRLGPLPDTAIESHRLMHRSRALIAAGDSRAALTEAIRAVEAAPQDENTLENLGLIALQSGDADRAVAALRDALHRAVERGGRRVRRARIYREIGQAEEARREMGRAYDAYSMALDLDPDEPIAAQRLRQMADAAGTLR